MSLNQMSRPKIVNLEIIKNSYLLLFHLLWSFELSVQKMASALLISSINPIKTQEFTQNGPKISSKIHPNRLIIRAVQEKTKEKTSKAAQPSADEITQKYGLEVGLWKIFSSKSKGDGKQKSKTDEAKELLAKYGGAYLATSITLSLISFALCYALVSAGIDVQALLSKVGIVTDEAGGKVGTFALAYAAHKAASPIRFPPTVALTPIVAGWIGKKSENTTDK